MPKRSFRSRLKNKNTNINNENYDTNNNGNSSSNKSSNMGQKTTLDQGTHPVVCHPCSTEDHSTFPESGCSNSFESDFGPKELKRQIADAVKDTSMKTNKSKKDSKLRSNNENSAKNSRKDSKNRTYNLNAKSLLDVFGVKGTKGKLRDVEINQMMFYADVVRNSKAKNPDLGNNSSLIMSGDSKDWNCEPNSDNKVPDFADSVFGDHTHSNNWDCRQNSDNNIDKSMEIISDSSLSFPTDKGTDSVSDLNYAAGHCSSSDKDMDFICKDTSSICKDTSCSSSNISEFENQSSACSISETSSTTGLALPDQQNKVTLSDILANLDPEFIQELEMDDTTWEVISIGDWSHCGSDSDEQFYLISKDDASTITTLDEEDYDYQDDEEARTQEEDDFETNLDMVHSKSKDSCELLDGSQEISTISNPEDSTDEDREYSRVNDSIPEEPETDALFTDDGLQDDPNLNIPTQDLHSKEVVDSTKTRKQPEKIKNTNDHKSLNTNSTEDKTSDNSKPSSKTTTQKPKTVTKTDIEQNSSPSKQTKRAKNSTSKLKKQGHPCKTLNRSESGGLSVPPSTNIPGSTGLKRKKVVVTRKYIGSSDLEQKLLHLGFQLDEKKMSEEKTTGNNDDGKAAPKHWKGWYQQGQFEVEAKQRCGLLVASVRAESDSLLSGLTSMQGLIQDTGLLSYANFSLPFLQH